MSNAPRNVTDWLPGLLGPIDFTLGGAAVEIPRRQAWNFIGDVEVEDDADNERTNIRIGTAITKDSDGVVHVSVTETTVDGDTSTTIRTLVGHASTPDATPLDVDLGTRFDVASGEVVAVDAIAVAKGTGKRARIKVSALVYESGGNATLEGTPDVDAKTNDASITATLVVSGAKFKLELTGIGAALTWGFELRTQKL